jgi:hypothetical protein
MRRSTSNLTVETLTLFEYIEMGCGCKKGGHSNGCFGTVDFCI